ncbi:hypothetical protein [Streptomyces sp. NPDC059708]|uniref:hypothetical protein n=1 Tax=Streptomyces sp. NPDC059708 TaxID=3346916 RepID=UPI0036C2186F
MVFEDQAESGAAGREEWHYSPAVSLGPLRFGMTVSEAVEAAEEFGQTKVSDCLRQHTVFSPTSKIDIHRRGAIPTPPAVTAYVSEAAGLFCLAVDAVQGPPVAYDGILLVGRGMAALERDAITYAEANDVQFRIMPEGYAAPDDPGIVMRAQLVSGILRSRPLFMVPRDGAWTEWDSLPDEEYRIDGRVPGSATPPDNPWPD